MAAQATHGEDPMAFRLVSSTYDVDEVIDPFVLFRALRRTSPVMAGDILARFGVPSQADFANRGRQVFSVFRHADVAAVLRDDKLWSTDLLADGLGAFLGDMFLSARDGPPHRQLRGLLQACFAPAALRDWNRQLIVPLAEAGYGAALRPRGKMELLADLALSFPIRAIYTILGFPDDPAAAERFADQALLILAGPQVDPEKSKIASARAFQAADELDATVRAIVAKKRRTGAEGIDMMSRLIRAEFEGHRLDDGQIAGAVRMMLPAAAETTTRTLANFMVHMLQNPSIMAQVRDDRSLLPKAIAESMRLEPVAGFLARRAVVDTDIDGVAIPAGAAVSLAIGSANRDEAVFEEPDIFRLDRPLKPAMGFGHGVHMCIGMPVARMELKAAINMLLDLPGLRPDPDHAPPAITGFNFRGPEAVHLVWDVQ